MNATSRKCLLAVALAFALTACGNQEAQQQAQSGDQAQTATSGAPSSATQRATHWSYEGETGPLYWGTLDPAYSLCGEGQAQSPIDIDNTAQGSLPPMRAQFRRTWLNIVHHQHAADIIDNGHTIQVNYTEGDTLAVGAESFALKQYHFHSPSEHTVGGEHSPMEMHLVHQSPEGKLAVIGVFIQEGAHNAAFDPIWANLPTQKGEQKHLEAVTVDVNALLPPSMQSYRYEGSLTTPPCSEGVQWIVMTTPIYLSADQIGAFRAIIHGNNRPTQELNGRTVVTDQVLTQAAK